MSLLKQHRGTSTLGKLTAELDKLKKGSNPGSSEDQTFWKLKTDKAKNGSALIRFLPEPKGESVPWVKLFRHAFEGNGGWYIENSRTTIEQTDPVAEYNRVLWNSGVEANKDIARKQKRKLQYVSNILVIKDPLAPENEGKVFRFKYGPRLFDKVTSACHPVDDGIEKREGFDPFCPYKGANFVLRQRTVADMPNYDESRFETPSALFGGDDTKIDALWAGVYPLAPLVAPSAFKSYEELKKRLDRVLGSNVAKNGHAPTQQTKSEPAPSRAKPVTAEDVSVDLTEDSDSSEDLSYLTSLASED